MRLVHSNLREIKNKAVDKKANHKKKVAAFKLEWTMECIEKAKKLKAKQTPVSQKESAQRWMAAQSRKDSNNALKNNTEALKEIHKVEPGWMPGMES